MNAENKTPMIERSNFHHDEQPEKIPNNKGLIGWLAESALLTGEWIKDIKKKGFIGSPTATAFATTPRAVRHVCRELALDQLRDGDIIVEAGTGGGVIMNGVMERVKADIRFIAIELNPTLAIHLERNKPDDRVIVINDSAEKMKEIVEHYGAAARRVISTMPLSTNKKRTETVLNQVKNTLTEDGVFVMGNFTFGSVMAVIDSFGRENCETSVAFNIPPLLTVRAKKPQSNGNGKH